MTALAVTGFVAAASTRSAAQDSASASVVVASPTYISIPLEITVNRPAAEVWKRIGKYCDISEWLQIAPPRGCPSAAGDNNELGALRGNEVLVGKTELSYTYVQTPRDGRPYNLYHGTLEVRPMTPTTSKILTTLFFDNSMLLDDTARQKDRDQRAANFTRALQNMKTLAEGGTLPPRQ
jgi:hypothetical protein